MLLKIKWHIVFTLLFLPFFFPIGSVLAAETGNDYDGNPANNSAQILNSILERAVLVDNAPEWLRRTTLNVRFEETLVPAIEIETVQPLFTLSDDDMFFTQINAASREWNERYNIGVGYRRIVSSGIILGGNAFYDYSEKHAHRRWGIGAEMLGKDYEARANTYFSESGLREVAPGTTQHVMGGVDIEAGGSLLPFYRDLRIYAGYRWFNVRETGIKDLKSIRLRAEFPISRYLGAEFRYSKNIDREQDATQSDTFFAQLYFGIDHPVKGGVSNDKEFRRKLLQPVERANDILVEQTTAKAGGLSVTVKRGN